MQGSRESTWPAPTAEDWQKPCLITFQRTWEDALAVAKERNMPILVCVNMDGEIASEHFAGIRYRQPDKAALYTPYVCVIASVYRHTPRDYDDQGRRIPCPRFGSVTCGEHIAIEPILYEKFMDGRRIAPRHIGVDLQEGGAEMYDVFYRYDVKSVFTDITESVADRPPPEPLAHGDWTPEERVGSRDIHDRETVERTYMEGDRFVRKRLLEAALVHRELDQIDLLRLALFGLDVELARIARATLAESTDEKAIDLIVEALRVPMEPEEREALLAALDRLAEQYPRARTLAAVHQGLARPSDALDVGGWADNLVGAEYPEPVEWGAVEGRIKRRAREGADQPLDPNAQLELAEAALALAVDPGTAKILAADYRTASAYSRLQFEDARRTAKEAYRLGARGWRVEAVLALSAFYLGDLPEAHLRAENSAKALPPGETSWNAMGVLALFAQARQRAIYEAARKKEQWPSQWLADVNAAYTVLGEHPLGADHQVAAHYDFLKALGAKRRAKKVLVAGLGRFPQSWMLHERLRIQGLDERGVEGLESAYDELLAANPRPPSIDWFAGYAALVSAEYYRRAGNAPAAEARLQSRHRPLRARDPREPGDARHGRPLRVAGAGRPRAAGLRGGRPCPRGAGDPGRLRAQARRRGHAGRPQPDGRGHREDASGSPPGEERSGAGRPGPGGPRRPGPRAAGAPGLRARGARAQPAPAAGQLLVTGRANAGRSGA